MKRFLLMFLLSIKLFSQNISIPFAIEEEIITWIKFRYPSNIFSEEIIKSMYEEEIESYKWIVVYALDLELLEQLKTVFPPQKFGYKVIKLMYETQIKEENK